MPTKSPIVMFRLAVAIGLASASGISNSQSAESSSPAERSEHHEALAFYEGTWTIPDKEHEGLRETCSWLAEGRRHVICRSRGQTANRPWESLGVYSYDQTRGEYLYHGFGSRGSVYIERGQRIPNGFIFTSESGAGADRVRTRFTIAEASGGRVSTVTETATADEPWVVTEKVEYLRTRP